jgi:hypothetical protein
VRARKEICTVAIAEHVRPGAGPKQRGRRERPQLRIGVPLSHPHTIALLGKLGAPPPLKVEGEEILGIIKGKAPVLKHDEDAAKPKRNSSSARQGGSLKTLRETSSLKTGPVAL